jgi:multidrug efflux system membrane fusion protein
MENRIETRTDMPGERESMSAQWSVDETETEEEAGPSWKAWLIGGVALVLLIGGYWYFNQGNAPARARRLPIPVRVGPVTRMDMPVVEHTLGTVVPNTTVQIASRVSGVITATFFKEGQMVKQGDLLFEIDPRPYQAAYDNAVATEANAKSKAERLQRLFRENAIGAQDNDDAQTAYAVAKAQAEAARLNLEFTKIKSPVDGKTGAMLVQQGNMVIANLTTTPLVTIDQIQPIKVSFALPQTDLPRIQARQKTPQGLTATISLQDNGGGQYQAPVDFLSNAVANVSGTIEMRASFKNEDASLVPGQLVNVTVQLNNIPNATVVPHQAVNIGPDGNFVYALKDDKAEVIPVKVLFDDGGSTAVEGDLQPGEQVVTDGQLRLVPGSTVEVAGTAPKRGAGGARRGGRGRRGGKAE